MSIIDRTSSPERTRGEVLTMCQLVAPLPEIVVRVIALLDKDDTDAAEVERHLENDPALTAKLLSHANSTLYGMSGEVGSISKAIVVIGFAGIRSLLLASSLNESLNRDYSCYGHSRHGLWRHSIAVAAGARSLSEALHQSNVAGEEIFVAGLLHDLGKMVLAHFLVDSFKPLAGVDIMAEEIERFGIDHGEAGALIAEKWKLGESLVHLIGKHHGEHEQQPEEVALQLSILRFAQWLAHDLGLGYLDGRAPKIELQLVDLERLQLTEDTWQQLRAGLEESIQQSLAAMNTMGGT